MDNQAIFYAKQQINCNLTKNRKWWPEGKTMNIELE